MRAVKHRFQQKIPYSGRDKKGSGRCEKGRKNTTINSKIRKAASHGFTVVCGLKRTLVLQKSGYHSFLQNSNYYLSDREKSWNSSLK